MPKYAHFDHTEPAPQRVRGWYNTDDRVHPNLPNPVDLIQVSETQWAARMSDPGNWAVKDGAVIPRPLAKPPMGPVNIAVPKEPVG